MRRLQSGGNNIADLGSYLPHRQLTKNILTKNAQATLATKGILRLSNIYKEGKVHISLTFFTSTERLASGYEQYFLLKIHRHRDRGQARKARVRRSRMGRKRWPESR